MNTKHVIAAMALLAAGTTAFAQPRNPPGADPLYQGQTPDAAPRKTRAQVVAELKEAIAQGKQLPIGEMPTYPEPLIPKR